MSLATWLTDSVTVASQSGVNGSGDPAYDAQRTIKARVVVGTVAGRTENPPKTVVYSEAEVLVTDRLWLPGTNTALVSDARRPEQVERAKDLSGARKLWKATL